MSDFIKCTNQGREFMMLQKIKKCEAIAAVLQVVGLQSNLVPLPVLGGKRGGTGFRASIGKTPTVRPTDEGTGRLLDFN